MFVFFLIKIAHLYVWLITISSYIDIVFSYKWAPNAFISALEEPRIPAYYPKGNYISIKDEDKDKFLEFLDINEANYEKVLDE